MLELRQHKAVRDRFYDLVDRADSWCLTNPSVPSFVRSTVGRLWEQTAGRRHGDVNDAVPAWSLVEIPCEWDAGGTEVDWLVLRNVHDRYEGCDLGCVVHNRTIHPMMFWPLHWRGDRRIFERVCECGVGHPDPDQFPYWRVSDQMWQAVHGCCGCCRPGALRGSDDE